MQFRLVNLFSHSSLHYDARDIWEAMERIKRESAPKYRFVLLGQDKAGPAATRRGRQRRQL